MARELRWLATAAVLAMVGCDGQLDGEAGAGSRGKTDTGWLSDTSYEVGAELDAMVARKAEGEWASLATDRALQEQLIDTQVKFTKRAAMAHGFEVNQLAHRIRSLEVTTDPATKKVTLRYRAAIDLVKNEGEATPLPKLEELPVRELEVPLPLDPTGLFARVGDRCAGDLEGYTLREDNYYYYFAPANQGCSLELVTGSLAIETVYPRRRAYPEYDRLLGPIPGLAARKGFRAALLPTEGDDDPASIFDGMKGMLEGSLGLEGKLSSDKRYVRYEWTQGGATIVIDLYDPMKSTSFKSSFQAALGAYQLVFFAGHSEYGTRTIYDDRTKFADGYQIVMMWACHSYAYYARQVFRAKASAADPDGFAAADFIGTAPTPFFGDETLGIRELLKGLMQGISTVAAGKPGDAPDWVTIIKRMNLTSMDKPYGVAGARDNAWQPAE